MIHFVLDVVKISFAFRQDTSNLSISSNNNEKNPSFGSGDLDHHFHGRLSRNRDWRRRPRGRRRRIKPWGWC
jgi:hypothetical protein